MQNHDAGEIKLMEGWVIGALRVERETWKVKKGLPSVLKSSFRNAQSCVPQLVMTQLRAYQIQRRVTKGTSWWVFAADQLIKKWMNPL